MRHHLLTKGGIDTGRQCVCSAVAAAVVAGGGVLKFYILKVIYENIPCETNNYTTFVRSVYNFTFCTNENRAR
jgi:hypothetical protein